MWNRRTSYRTDRAAAASSCSPVDTHLIVTLLYKVLHKTNRFSVSNQRITSISKGQYVWIEILTVVGTYWPLMSFTEYMKQWTVFSTCFILKFKNLTWILECCLKLPLSKQTNPLTRISPYFTQLFSLTFDLDAGVDGLESFPFCFAFCIFFPAASRTGWKESTQVHLSNELHINSRQHVTGTWRKTSWCSTVTHPRTSSVMIQHNYAGLRLYFP